MLHEKTLLMLPGPTPVPPQVAAAMTTPMINHRGSGFAELFQEVATGLQPLFGTHEPVYVIPGAGSGGWETALLNFVPAGSKILVVSSGDFGERWAKAAAALGYQVEKLDFTWGTAADPAVLAERLARDDKREIRAVTLTHNETSTGVTNPIQELAAAVHRHGALVLVDSVSGVGAMPMAMDAWGVDVVLTGAQKALMCPPGLTIVAASQRAWATSEEAGGGPRFFFDLRPYREMYTQGQTPYTPAVSLYQGLRAALEMIRAEGREQIFARHRLMRDICRAGVRAMGLELLVTDEAHASAAVTAIKAPPGVSPNDIRKVALKQFGVILAPGQGRLKSDGFRIGHLGYVTPNDVLVALIATEQALRVLGHPVTAGSAAAAAQETWLAWLQNQR